MNTRIGRRTLAVAAALGLACLAPGAAFAADSAPDRPSTSAQERAYVPNYEDAVGHATFESHGERLFACDDRPDNATVKATLKWTGEYYTVKDENGAVAGCGEAGNMPNIPEGDTVYIRASASGFGHGDWVKAYA